MMHERTHRTPISKGAATSPHRPVRRMCIPRIIRKAGPDTDTVDTSYLEKDASPTKAEEDGE
jgi:hypothetical protein